jgi:hypothetical protein
MLRKYYFPKIVAAQPGWLSHFAEQLPRANVELGLPEDAVAQAVADAAWLAYVWGPWFTQAQQFGPTVTAAARDAARGAAHAPFVLPVFTPPPLPEGVVPVLAGALPRIFAFVQAIKAAKKYTETIGRQLGIIGAEAATAHPLPTFTLRVERGEAGEWVRVSFRRFGRPGVVIWGRRGTGEWEQLAISLKSPHFDRRPLLVAGQPEVREYRLQSYEGHAPASDFTAIASATVAP